MDKNIVRPKNFEQADQNVGLFFELCAEGALNKEERKRLSQALREDHDYLI
jgi:hypothetical protein